MEKIKVRWSHRSLITQQTSITPALGPIHDAFIPEQVMIYIDDIDENTAPFSIVPGSHTLRQGEPLTDAEGKVWDAHEGGLRADPAQSKFTSNLQ